MFGLDDKGGTTAVADDLAHTLPPDMATSGPSIMDSKHRPVTLTYICHTFIIRPSPTHPHAHMHTHTHLTRLGTKSEVVKSNR